jgi:hypothetical protein
MGIANTGLDIKAIWVGDPSAAARGDPGYPEGDAVAVAQFGFAVGEQTDQRPIDVAEAEEAEVVSADENLLDGCGAGRRRCLLDLGLQHFAAAETCFGRLSHSIIRGAVRFSVIGCTILPSP